MTSGLSMGQSPHSTMRAMAGARKRMLARIGNTMSEPDERFPAAFARLAGELEAGLRHEETLMESAGYPGLREQRQDNAVLLAALHRALPAVEAGDLAIGRDVVAALRNLLSLHRFSGLRILATARRSVLPRAAGAWRERALHRERAR